jgi:hypothetical protein
MKGMRAVLSLAGAVGCTASVGTAGHCQLSAQQVVAEFRFGGSVGSHTATAAGLELAPGPSIVGLLEISLVRSVYAYGGLIWTTFGCEEGFCSGRDIQFSGQSLALGFGLRPRPFWTRVALLYGVIAPEDDETQDLGLGFAVSSGVDVYLGRFRFSPGLAYRRHFSDTDRAVSLSGELGLGLPLGG